MALAAASVWNLLTNKGKRVTELTNSNIHADYKNDDILI